VLGLLAINLVFTLVNADTVSWQGHIGGLVMGLVLGAVYAFAPRRHYQLWSVIATVLAAALVLGVYAVLAAELPTDVSSFLLILYG
jgi:hypothetical protein